jgi:hypothetical protein
MSDKRQKNQLQMVLAFAVEGRSEAPKARREGTESLTANGETESPAGTKQLMEEVCDRENLKRALRHESRRVTGLSETALASHSGTTAERNLSTATGEASGDRQAGRGSAQAGHSHGAGIDSSSKR